MEISSPIIKEQEEIIDQNVHEETESKPIDIPERQTRQSSRRRQSTNASQSMASPSPSNGPEIATPTSSPPPGAQETTRSQTEKEAPYKEEQMEPVPELSAEESVQEYVQVGKDDDIEEVKPADEEIVSRMSQPTEEDQNQELLDQSQESTPAPQGRSLCKLFLLKQRML